jgi:broad specificity phosphatase PhoE
VQTAEIAAATLGLDTVTVLAGLRQITVGDQNDTPGGAGLRDALEVAADQYRGETVLVVTDGRTIRAAVSELCVNTRPARSWDLDHGQAARISAGSEVWRLTTWAHERIGED